ncbi:MAG: FxLYD domain-containing protein [Anaerolineales bacterium]
MEPNTRRIGRDRHSVSPLAMGIAAALATPACSVLLLLGFFWWRSARAPLESAQLVPTVAATSPTPATMTAAPAVALVVPTPGSPAAITSAVTALPSATDRPAVAIASVTPTIAPITPTSTAQPTTQLTSTPTLTSITSSPSPSLESTSATPVAASSPTPTVTATASATAAGVWSFSGLQSYYSAEDEAYRVFGEVVNNTGQTQDIETITGQFFDAQGQVIAGDADIAAAFPVSLIPAARSAPFDLYVDNAQSADRFELNVVAMPSTAILRSDFVIAGLSAAMENTNYCIRGTLQNPGPRPQSTVTLVAVIYDAQNRVINYGYSLRSTSAVPENSSTEVKVCVPEPNANVVSQIVTAWGR